MKMPIRSLSHNRLVYQDKLEEREIWYKLVVKVLKWKDDLFSKDNFKLKDKITPKEWNVYAKRMILKNTSYDKEKVKANLKETKQLIKKNGGFIE